MSVTPSLGRRGTPPLDTTSPRREEAIQRLWTFLVGISAKALRFYGESPEAGSLLSASDANGNSTWTRTLPATTAVLTGQTISQTATLIATATGEYLATVYLQCTTAGAAGTLDATFSYSDDVGAVTTPVVATLVMTGTGRAEGRRFLRCSAGGIDYTLTVTGAVGGPVYAAHIALTKVR